MTKPCLKLTNIQALRGFAAVNVVLYHIVGNSAENGHPTNYVVTLGGSVDLFFVISGFIMVYIQFVRQREPGQFLLDRVVRIAPTYWLLNIALGIALFAAPGLFGEMRFSVNWLINSLLFISQPLGHNQPILYVGWTIEYEMLFYVVFAASLFLKSLLASIAATSLALGLLVLGLGAEIILLEFIAGMTIGWFYLQLNPGKNLSWAALLCGSALLFSTSTMDGEMSRIIVYGIPSALIVFGALNIVQMNSNFLTKLGDSSFSIYLIQVFTIPAFYRSLNLLGITGISGDLAAILCLVFSVLTGILLHEVFEKRSQMESRQLLRQAGATAS